MAEGLAGAVDQVVLEPVARDHRILLTLDKKLATRGDVVAQPVTMRIFSDYV